MNIQCPYESRYLQTGAFRTHYIEAGEDQVANGTVILIHGGGPGANAWGNWFSCFEYFAPHFRTIAIDLAGYGDTEPNEGFGHSQPERNQQVIDFIEGLGVGPVSIVGNSMGGACGLGVAMKRPELLKNLVLMGSAGLNYSVGRVGEAMKPIGKFDYTAEGLKKIVGVLGGKNYQPTPGMLEYRLALASRPERKAAFTAIDQWIWGNGGLHYEEADIGQVKTRTLVVSGKEDKIVILPQSVRFLELLQNSFGFIIPDCGHWAMLEHPKVFSEETVRFLKGY